MSKGAPRGVFLFAVFVVLLMIGLSMSFYSVSYSNPSGFTAGNSSILGGGNSSSVQIYDTSQYYYQGYSYNPSAAVEYGLMIDTKYYHTEYYPSGSNSSVLQKNLDYFNSEDCAHFVSEALIAGGLTALANNPPGDNLTNYGAGFPGSYGIVGVYRLADYLAGYDLPVFPNNATDEQIVEYQPIPASYTGSPHASIYYVENESMMPSYFLSPGDVIVDGGAGNGHAMLYIGNGLVVQTDPAGKLVYYPGINYNISFDGYLTLDGENVTAIYIHMPTISAQKAVRITMIYGKEVFNSTNEAAVPANATVEMVASFPDGVGFGNYTYTWYDNGKIIANSQIVSLSAPKGVNHYEVVASGSNGTAYQNFTVYSGVHPFGIFGLNTIDSEATIGFVIVIVATAGFIAVRRMKK